MKNKAKITFTKDNRIELLINDEKIENIVALTEIRNLHSNDTLKEIDITLLVSEVEVVNMHTGITKKYPPDNAE